LHCNIGTVFSTRSTPRSYKHDKSGAVGEELTGELLSQLKDFCDAAVVSWCCEKFVAEARNISGTQRNGTSTVESFY
jgi:hypothetical protein